MHHTITAKGNPLMLIQFRKDLKKMLTELQRIESKEGLNEAIEQEVFTPIATMLQILESFQENSH